jgi:quercetin dioxygenase-like cupin family protein
MSRYKHAGFKVILFRTNNKGGFMSRKAVLVRCKDKITDTEHEPPFQVGRGICSETVEKSSMIMSHVVIPPGGRNRRQYHVNCDSGIHVLKGRLVVSLGSNIDLQEGIVEEGDFVFIPKGTIHGLKNYSDTEQAEMIRCQAGIGHKNEAGTFYVESALGK